MKQDILLGCYGWRHANWSETFYPEGLPDSADDDWRLSYYSNEFNAVMVPASYWFDEGVSAHRCSSWMEDVNEQFRFVVECRADMFQSNDKGFNSFESFSDCLQVLQPQTAAMVLSGNMPYPVDSMAQFERLAGSSGVELYAVEDVVAKPVSLPVKKTWCPGRKFSSGLALIENDLENLRHMRQVIENFAACRADESTASVMIIKHEGLKASNLSDLRSVLEIMGF